MAVCLASTLWVLLAHPRTAAAERLAIQHYTTSDGLAHDRVRCIVPDARGFIWFCGPNGLSRFDGRAFTTYGVAQGLPHVRVNHFLESSRREYWLATNGGGVYRFNPLTQRHSIERAGGAERSAGETSAAARFTAFTVGDEPQTNRVNVLREDRAGRLWAGTDGGLFYLEARVDGAVFRRAALDIPGQPDRAVHVWALAEDRDGILWIGTSWGLVRRVADGRVSHAAVQPSQGSDHVRALVVDRDNNVWIGHNTGTFVVRADSIASDTPAVVLRYTTGNTTSSGMVRALMQSLDGTVWIGTWDGLTRFDGQTFEAFGRHHGIPRTLALTEDRDRNIWIGTETGALKLNRNGFTAYTEADGLADSIIRTIFEDPSGELYVVSNNQRIHRFNGARFDAVRPNLSKDVSDPVGPGVALRDRDGDWWIPGGAGLYRFPSVTRIEQLAHVAPKALYTTADGLAGDDVFRLFEDSRGDIWIGRLTPTSSVVTRWHRATNRFYRYTDADGLPPFNRITAFAEDRSGGVWMGFQNGGVARYRDGRFLRLTHDDGAPRDWVTALHVDSRNRLWIGARRPALSRIDSPDAERPVIAVSSGSGGVAGDTVACITDDLLGRLYLGVQFGRIDRFDPASGQIRHYTAGDGLTGRTVTAAFRDRRGALWFAGYDGLLRFAPSPDPPPSAPAVLIAHVRVAGEPYVTSDLGERAIPRFELGPHNNQVQIEYFGFGTPLGGELRYRYRLEGADRRWSPPTADRVVTYASLSPGDYRFIVETITDDVSLTPSRATVEFTVLPPLWARSWFVLLLAGAFGTAGYSVHRTRLARLVELERIRARIATDLHDDLGSNLSQIAILSEVLLMDARNREGRAARLLSVIASTANESVESMSDIVWAINPKSDSLESLLRRMRRFAGEGFTARNIDFAFHAGEVNPHLEVGAETRRDIFLVFKELVNNIIRHSHCTRAQVVVELESGFLTVRVSDNGRGFNPLEESDGHGLASMRGRARNLSGTLDVISTPGEGTVITLRARLSRRHARSASLHTSVVSATLPVHTVPADDQSGRD